jgi:WD40 repeat protein
VETELFYKELVTAIAFAPDGNWIATTEWTGTVRPWNVP